MCPARHRETSTLLLCEPRVPLAATLEAFRLARAAGGWRTVLTPAPAMELP